MSAAQSHRKNVSSISRSNSSLALVKERQQQPDACCNKWFNFNSGLRHWSPNHLFKQKVETIEMHKKYPYVLLRYLHIPVSTYMIVIWRNPPNHLQAVPRYYHGGGSKMTLLPRPRKYLGYERIPIFLLTYFRRRGTKKKLIYFSNR